MVNNVGGGGGGGGRVCVSTVEQSLGDNKEQG